MKPVTNELKWKPAGTGVEKGYVGDNTNEAFTLTTIDTDKFFLSSDITREELQTSGQFDTVAEAKTFAQNVIKKHNIFAGTAWDGMPSSNKTTLPA